MKRTSVIGNKFATRDYVINVVIELLQEVLVDTLRPKSLNHIWRCIRHNGIRWHLSVVVAKGRSLGSLRCYANIKFARTAPILNVKNTQQMAARKLISKQITLTNLDCIHWCFQHSTNLVTGVCVISLGCLDVLTLRGIFEKRLCVSWSGLMDVFNIVLN